MNNSIWVIHQIPNHIQGIVGKILGITPFKVSRKFKILAPFFTGFVWEFKFILLYTTFPIKKIS